MRRAEDVDALFLSTHLFGVHLSLKEAKAEEVTMNRGLLTKMNATDFYHFQEILDCASEAMDLVSGLALGAIQ